VPLTSDSTAPERSAAKPKKERAARPATKPVTSSTLIEFPGGGRVPQWRKELSERVREVQKRRAQEAATEELAVDTKTPPALTPAPIPLGLVRPAAAPAINPLVMKALLRIERAHRAPIQPTSGFSRGGTALARQPEAIPEVDALPEPSEQTPPAVANTVALAPAAIERSDRAPKEHSLVVVPPKPESALPNEVETSKPKSVRLINAGVEEAALSYLENLQTANTVFGTSRDDRANIFSRLAAALVDLLVIAFASCPFAAGIELWGSNWNDLRVKGIMAGIAIVVAFLYLTIVTALAGRTAGMKLFGIRAVDVRSGLMPSGSQSARRALGYIFSLATAGLGIFYGLVDAEHRTAHDHFSGTIVVHD
jgi:uncharacterized RDD family membrane protein YckC